MLFRSQFSPNCDIYCVTKTIRWNGGTVGASSTEAYDIFNFVGINTVGSASTTVNYQVLGQSNNDFRTY